MWHRLGLSAQLVGREVIDIDDFHDLAVVVTQRRRFSFRDDADGECLLDLARQIERRYPARLHALSTNTLLERLHGLREQQRFLQQSEGIRRLQCPEHVLTQPLTRVGGVQDQVGHLPAETIGSCRVGASARQDQEAHDTAQKAKKKKTKKTKQQHQHKKEQKTTRPLYD